MLLLRGRQIKAAVLFAIVVVVVVNAFGTVIGTIRRSRGLRRGRHSPVAVIRLVAVVRDDSRFLLRLLFPALAPALAPPPAVRAILKRAGIIALGR